MTQPVTAEQIKQEQLIFTKSWELLKTYYSLDMNSKDEEWQELITDAGTIAELQTGSSKGNQFAKEIVLAVLNHIDTLSHDRKERTIE